MDQEYLSLGQSVIKLEAMVQQLVISRNVLFLPHICLSNLLLSVRVCMSASRFNQGEVVSCVRLKLGRK